MAETTWVRINPTMVMMVSLLAGLVCGALMILPDPWLRFGDVSARINWQEVWLAAAIAGCYGLALGWLLTSFWRSRFLWAAAILLSPVLTLAVAVWNALYGAFGFPADLVVLYPFVALIHLLLIALIVVYLNMILRFPSRQVLAYTAIPLVLFAITLPGVGRLRWLNPEAQQIMTATDNYASQTVDDAYQLEFLGTRYRTGGPPTGSVRIHTASESLICRVRLFPQNTNVSCEEE